MVRSLLSLLHPLAALSVLALSSRFDGHLYQQAFPHMVSSFSTRSVESF